MVLIAIILLDLLTGMEFDLFVPSFPELKNHFGLSSFWVEALISANFMGYCLSLFFVGALADRYGRKFIILFGLLIFIIGTLLCLWSPFYIIMLIGRFLQGMGIAAPAILSFLIIADTYPLSKQQSLFAILNGVMNAAAGLAPVLGSYITLYFHWQGNFMTFLLLGMITCLMVLLFIPTYKQPEHKETFSWRGYLPLFYSKSLMIIIVFFIFNFVPYWIFVGISPILYIENLGVSLSYFGYYQGTLAFVFAIGSLLFGLIVNSYNQKKMLLISAQIFMVGLISLLWVTALDSHNPLFITVAFLPFVLGQIIPGSILYPLCLNLMPQAKGRITAILQGGRLVFSSFCLQLAGYYYEGSFQNIGIIIISFVFMTIIALFFVINNWESMDISNYHQ